jgi:hypothetical protein
MVILYWKSRVLKTLKKKMMFFILKYNMEMMKVLKNLVPHQKAQQKREVKPHL